MKCPKCGRTRLDTYCPKTQTRCEENIRQVISNLHTLEYLPPFLTSDRILIREEAKRIIEPPVHFQDKRKNYWKGSWIYGPTTPTKETSAS